MKFSPPATFEVESPDGKKASFDIIQIALEIETIGLRAVDDSTGGRKVIDYWVTKLADWKITLTQAYEIMMEFSTVYEDFQKKMRRPATGTPISPPPTDSSPTPTPTS